METFVFLFEKCRLCLENSGVRNIFGCDITDLAESIFLCTGLRIHPKDSLPQKICSKCLEVIQNAKQLRDQALRNNTHLRSLFVVDGVDETENIIQHNNEKNNKETTDPNQMEIVPSVNISVRKDLFEPLPNKTSTEGPQDANIEDVVDDVHSCRKIRLDDDSVLFECSICFKTYDRWKKLYLHYRHHKKVAACEVCGKKFSTKGDLEKHVRIHTGEKPFKCNQCDRSFSQRVTLKVHRERVHCVLLA